LQSATRTERGIPRVAIVGAGALGCQAASSFAATDTATVTLVDFDRVERSNIRRQILYDEDSIGRAKAPVAARVLQRDFPGARPVTPRIERVEGEALERLVTGHDIIVDATDDPATKFALNRTCRRHGTTLVYGGATRTRGLAMVVAPASEACLECVFAPDGDGAREGCALAGVLAPIAGLVGALQALLAIRVWGGDEKLLNHLFVYQATPRRWHRMRVYRDARCRACENAAAHAA
jgi:molybdopterin/thiamine biosynthesis adenylyltransferase